MSADYITIKDILLKEIEGNEISFSFSLLTSPPGSGIAPNLALRLAISTVGPTKRLVPESAILFKHKQK